MIEVRMCLGRSDLAAKLHFEGRHDSSTSAGYDHHLSAFRALEIPPIRHVVTGLRDPNFEINELNSVAEQVARSDSCLLDLRLQFAEDLTRDGLRTSLNDLYRQLNEFLLAGVGRYLKTLLYTPTIIREVDFNDAIEQENG